MSDVLKNYCDYSKKITDAPENYHIFGAIFTMAAIINRTRHIQFGSSHIYPNFWAIFLAKSSFSRKTTVLRISEGFIKKADPLLLYPCEFSHEKLIEVLAEKPKGIFYYSEFKTLMGLLSKDYMMGTKSFLTEIFDCGDYSRQTKGLSLNIENACMNLLSATTSDWFNSSIKGGDLEGGFLGRFLYINANKKMRNDGFPPKPDRDLQIKINNEIQMIIKNTQGQTAEMELSDDSMKTYLNWYNFFCNKMDEMPNNIHPLFSRLNIYLLKISIVLQTCKDYGLTIDNDTIKISIEIIDNLVSNTLNLCETDLSFTPHEADEKKILKWLKKCPSGESVRSKVLRNSHLSAFSFNNALKTLIDKEMVRTEQIKIADKPTEIIKIIRDL